MALASRRARRRPWEASITAGVSTSSPFLARRHEPMGRMARRGAVRWAMADQVSLGHRGAVTDAELVEAITAGDRDAFRVIVEREAALVFRCCYRVLGDVAEAEDAAQEAFVLGFRALGTYRGSGSLSAWLARIATSLSGKPRQQGSARSRAAILSWTGWHRK